MELKTLKDLLFEYDGEFLVNDHTLKAEAIKWVLDLIKNENYIQATIMRSFFNITEEDLK